MSVMTSQRHTTGHSATRPTNAPGRGRCTTIAVASFFVMFLISTMMRCTGILFLSWQNAFDASAVQTGGISSIVTSTVFLGSALSGVVCNRFGYRFTCILGGFLTSFAMFMTPWASNLIHMYTLAFFTGLGISLCYMAATVAVADYFRKYYAQVSGICMAGSSTFMVVSPPLFHLLLDAYGWRGTMLVAAAMCANLCVAGALYRSLHGSKVDDCNPNRDERLSEGQNTHQQVQVRSDVHKLKRLSLVGFLKGVFSAFKLELMLKSYRFSLLCLTCVELQMIYSCSVIFLVPRAQISGIDELKASFLLSMFGFGSLGARLSSGFFVTRKTPVEALCTCSFVLCCVGLLCSQAETYESFAASACIVGMCVGATTAWNNILLRKLVGLRHLASGQAIMLLFSGVGNLIGPIVAGLAYDSTGAFSTVFYVLAGLGAAAALQMLLMPLLRRIESGIDEERETPNN
ncbi:monocarboxylate transporter 14-like [Patiria miniata]|uniref:Major facilitator superfamily (MFS) profile domain-containing protein n=1 Tax=Patiria miniata TaxID=46514 RepID=A0A913ZR08_PATMI|nr:monocarboxylate transporter 14-like [Patiria miniata]